MFHSCNGPLQRSSRYSEVIITFVARLPLSPVTRKLYKCEHGVFTSRTSILEHRFPSKSFAVFREAFSNAYPDKEAPNISAIHELITKFGTGECLRQGHGLHRRVLTSDKLCNVEETMMRPPMKYLTKMIRENWIVTDKCSSTGQTVDAAALPISVTASAATARYSCKNSILPFAC